MIQERDSTVSVVVAALNEESGIGPTIEEIQRFLNYPHMIVVDGNSQDKTVMFYFRKELEKVTQCFKGFGS